jgi:murein DD-endopeptidase MepM/ murein hydrolase activator NlpD
MPPPKSRRSRSPKRPSLCGPKPDMLRTAYGTSLMLVAIASCTSAPSSSAPAATESGASAEASEAAAEPSAMETARADANIARADFWLASDPVQGAVIVGRAPSGAKSVALNGQPLEMAADGFFLMGFDRDAENSASLTATLSNGKRVEKYLPVRPGDWKIERVNANPTGGAGTTAEFQQRRGPELARINAARRLRVESNGWRQEFIWPVKGRLSGFFGAQRIYNGSPGSYHSGMDIAVPAGTNYVAPADGVVILAAEMPFTLEGHLLMIDHGMGLNSAFLHSSALLVKEGDTVRQGQVIGKVGMTGRASGPHLHWGMKWNAARVDPKLLVPAF